jgi:hypothetical protein
MPIILQSKFFEFMIFRVMRGSPNKRKIGLLVCLGLILVVSLSGCYKANVIYGQSQIDDGLTNIVKIDTLNPVVSTLFVDSIATSAKGLLFCGGYNDPYYGPIKTRSYFELSPPTYTALAYKTVFDSMTLYLVPSNKYYYGDTTVPLNIYANKIAYTMFFPVYSSQFYNNDSFPTNYYLGHVQTMMRPTYPDTVYMHLDSTMGAQLFARYLDNDPVMTSTSQFLQYFPGIQLSTDGNAGNIYAFKDSVMVKIWYHDFYTHAVNAIQFKYVNKAYQFNEIRNTPIAPLNQFNHHYDNVVQQIYSTTPGFQHLGYLNPLLGYTIKFEFPGLRGLYQADSNFVKILKAELITRPIPNSFSYFYQLPSTVELYATNGFTNQPGSAVTTGTLTVDYLGGGPLTNYSYDITSYLLSEIANMGATYNGDGLIMQPSSTYFTQFNRTVIGDREYVGEYSAPDYYQSQVVLYYVAVKNSLQ